MSALFQYGRGFSAPSLPADFLQDPGGCLRRRGTLIKDSGFHRLVFRLEGLLVKEFVFSGLLERLKWRRGFSAPQKEWRALEALSREGVSVPAPVAFGSVPEGKGVRVWLVTEFLEGCVTYDTLRPDFSVEKTQGLARLIAGMHAAFFVHRDLHAGNLLWQPGSGRWFVTDFQHASRGFATRVQLVGDLVQLQHCLGKKVPLRQRVVFLREYIRSFAEFTDTLETHDRSDWHGVWYEVRERLLGYDIRQAASRSKRAFKKNRDYLPLDTPFGSGYAMRGESSQLLADIAALLAGKDWTFDSAVSRVHRHGRRISAVYDHPQGRVAFTVEEAPLAFWERLCPAWRRDLALWRGAARLLLLHVPVERPLLVLRNPRSLVYACLAKGDFSLKEACGLQGLPFTRKGLIRRLARLVARLHNCGAAHGRLTLGNIWLSEGGELYLRHLERLSFHGEVPWFSRVRDLSDLLFSALGEVDHSGQRLFLRHYARACSEQLDLRLLLSDVNCRTGVLIEERERGEEGR